jgi:glycosyltransferase involved in cell wall biosynthesis
MASVSVAMATFNGARYIRQQLDGLAAQSQLPSELVVTDDGSTDATMEIVEEFAGAAPFPVRIRRNQVRLGYRANFMSAAILCQSDLIAFCDQDDIWYPQKIAISVEPFSDPEVLLVHHNADVIYEGTSRTATLESRKPGLSMHPPLTLSPWSATRGFTQMLRRSLSQFSDLWPTSLDEIYSQERIAHDKWFLFLASVFGTVTYMHVPLAAYRQHEGNVYGYQTERILAQAAQSMLRNYAERYSGYARAAETRGAILEAAKSMLTGVWRDRASVAGAKYRRLAQQYADRKVIYTAAEAASRLTAFRRIYASGGYGRSDRYSLGPKSLVKDAFVGIVAGPRLKRAF